MSPPALTGDAKADHRTAADMIMQLFDSQTNHAWELGKSSALSGLEIDDNPFEESRHEPLINAWWRGFRSVRKDAS